LGDGGYIGAPSLSPEPQAIAEFEQPVPTFAFLYEPFVRIGLRPYDCERFHQWLEAHPNHRIALYSEQAPPEEEVLTSRPDWRREFVQEQRRQEVSKAAALESGNFVEALYVLRCKQCDTQVSSSYPDALKVFGPFTVKESDLALLGERWELIDAWVYRQVSAINETEPLFRELLPFLQVHVKHGVEASLESEGA
jgi:hypothetical protein